MKRRILVVGADEETAGFRLAGVMTVPEDTAGLAERLAAEDAIILATRGALAKLGGGLEKVRARNLVQEIPPPREPYKKVAEIIRRTVGLESR
jgi:vacuolar-type H+-ATPase subunit F/Vma7